jgi:CheY-like chemotaxis protein
VLPCPTYAEAPPPNPPGARPPPPVRLAARRRAKLRDATAGTSTEAEPDLGRVLVVEDERTIRLSIAGYLEDAGYTVDQAENGADALDRMQQAVPDVIVLDLLMPVMGGRPFVAALRGNPRFGAVPVVLLSAAHDLPQAAEELQPRASLAKPVDLDVLLAVVDRVART